jgi:hypothetical protein
MGALSHRNGFVKKSVIVVKKRGDEFKKLKRNGRSGRG